MSERKPFRPLRSLLVWLLVAFCVALIGFALFSPDPTSQRWHGTAVVAQQSDPVPAAAPAQPPQPAVEDGPAFRRGVNLTRLLNFSRRDPQHPGQYLYPPFEGGLASMTETEFTRLKALGFDFVRLPVDPGPFLEAGDADARLLFDRMRAIVTQLRRHGFAVLLDIHPETFQTRWGAKDILADPAGEKLDRYIALLVEVATMFRDLPADAFALELMNEPQPVCERTDGEDWTVTQKRVFGAVRATAPAMPLVVTGGCWSSVDGLLRLDPADFDTATLFDFHFYEPFFFTHQSLRWTSITAAGLAGVTYPAASGSAERTLHETNEQVARLRASGMDVSVADVATVLKEVTSYYVRHRPSAETIGARFDQVAAWADGNGVERSRVIMGEFSATRWPEEVTDDGSRLRWIADVRKIAEARGFGWALWDYFTGFGLLADNTTREVDKGTAQALGLDTAVLP